MPTQPTPSEVAARRLVSVGLEHLIPLLNPAQCVIAGSFPIQCALNTAWPDADIDIWIKDGPSGDHYSYMCPLQKMFEASGFFKSHTSSSGSSQYLRFQTHISKIHTFFPNEHDNSVKVQVITVKPDFWDVVFNSFDITACATIIMDEKLTFKFVDEQSVKDKQIVINENIKQTLEEWDRTLRRVSKYLNRGFECSEDEYVKILEGIRDNFKNVEFRRWGTSGMFWKLYVLKHSAYQPEFVIRIENPESHSSENYKLTLYKKVNDEQYNKKATLMLDDNMNNDYKTEKTVIQGVIPYYFKLSTIFENRDEKALFKLLNLKTKEEKENVLEIAENMLVELKHKYLPVIKYMKKIRRDRARVVRH